MNKKNEVDEHILSVPASSNLKMVDNCRLFGTMTNMNDIHYWVVNKDGSVHDPHFPSYDIIKAMHGLEGEPQYQEFPKEIQRQIWKYHWKVHVKPFKHMSKQDIANNPLPGMCWLNAYCYKATNKGCRVAVGRMGWQRRNADGIHWEYG